MNPEETSPAIVETEKVKFYEAFGGISGILDTSDSEKLVVLVEDRIYPVFATTKTLEQHQPGVVQNFNIHIGHIHDELGFVLLCVKEKARTTYNLKGCWEIRRGLPKFMVYRNPVPFRYARAVLLTLIWDDAPAANGQYWEIAAELIGDNFVVLQAIGPFKPPQKYQKRVKKDFSNAKSDLPRPTLKDAEPKAIKSELPPPTLKSAKASIAPLAPMVIDSPESQPIAESTVPAKAVDVIEATASEDQAIAPASKESIAALAPMEIEPSEPEVLPVVTEAMTPKAKKAGSKSSASKKSLITEGASVAITPETVEPTKEKVKSSRSKKSMSLAADRLFLGKQLPPGK